jgi:hypothetical protein
MKHPLATLVALLPFAVTAHAAVIFGGDFQLYKPGEPTVTATLTGGWVPWNGVIPPTNLTVSAGSANYSDSTSGPTVDLLGWTKIQGNTDILANGPGGSLALNLYGSWGGQSRVVTASSLGTITAGQDYTISAMIGGPGTGPIGGPLAFHLLANGVELIPNTSINPDTSGTYQAADLVGYIGQQMSIVVGVANDNAIGNRVIFDDVSLAAIPEPAPTLLLGLGGFVLAFSRSRRK